jgi:hypothetical protein
MRGKWYHGPEWWISSLMPKGYLVKPMDLGDRDTEIGRVEIYAHVSVRRQLQCRTEKGRTSVCDTMAVNICKPLNRLA